MNLIGKSTRASRFVLHPARGSDQASFSCVDQPSDLSPRSGRTITFRFIRRLRFLGQRTGHAGTACPITTETVSEEDVGLPDTDRDQAVRSDSVCTKANLIYSGIKLTKLRMYSNMGDIGESETRPQLPQADSTSLGLGGAPDSVYRWGPPRYHPALPDGAC